MLTIIGMLMRPVTIAPNWVLAANLVLLPACAVAAAWVVMTRSNWGLALSMLVLVLSWLMGHPIFDVPLLMCAVVVTWRSVQACANGSAPFLLRS